MTRLVKAAKGAALIDIQPPVPYVRSIASCQTEEALPLKGNARPVIFARSCFNGMESRKENPIDLS
jgi:hypothetical protein